jgi:hypothetical protein
MKIHPRAKESSTHCITHKNGIVTVDRLKPPVLKVFYDPETKTGNLLSSAGTQKKIFLKKKFRQQ